MWWPLLKVVSYKKRIEIVMNPLGSITNPEKKTAVISHTIVLLSKGTAPGWLLRLTMLDRNEFVYEIFAGISVFLTLCLETARRRQVFHHFVQGVCSVSKSLCLVIYFPLLNTTTASSFWPYAGTCLSDEDLLKGNICSPSASAPQTIFWI